MSDFSKVDKNFVVETKIEKEGIKFYNCLAEPFKVYGVYYEDGKFRRMPEKIAPELFVCNLPEAAAAEPEYLEKTWTRDIYPENFTGKEICRLSTLQSWSFRPAEKMIQG